MAEAHSASKNTEPQQQWATNKARALELCSMALETANTLFDEGDLRPYITILSRFHCYNFYNLLLIQRQYPNATCLTTFNEWRQHMENPNWQVLKKEHIGKGIELVAPFTNLQPRGTRSLSWYSIKQFDISQTNVKTYAKPKSIYLSGPDHLETLFTALRGVISREYRCVVIQDHIGSFDYDTGIPGYKLGFELHVRPDLSNNEAILWLSQNLIELSEPEIVVGERYRALFTALVQNCLLQIWDIQDRNMLFLYQDADLVRSIPDDLRSVFLDFLQRRVRYFAEQIHCEYSRVLHDKEDILIDDIQDLRKFEQKRKEGERP